VTLLDENFKEIKSVSSLFYRYCFKYCALNKRNEIYVSVHQKNCNISFDLNLNKLKQFGSQGTGDNHLFSSSGLCCHGVNVYIFVIIVI